MTKVVTLSALACALLASASAASILGRAAVPAAGPNLAAIERPVSNRDSKTDKLVVPAEPAEESDAELQNVETPPARPVQLAYAGSDDEIPVAAIPNAGVPADDSASPKSATRLPPVIASAPAAKPKAIAKPAPKEAALLSDGQIAQIKTRLNLSSSQAYYWPSVEEALRAIGRKLHATRRDRDNGPPPIDPDSAEVQQLKYAAMPLLFQLREDQKHEVRKLARSMGLEQVAQQI